MRDGRAEALGAAIAEGARQDAILRRAYADLRETCASAIDLRAPDRDLARLIARYLDADGAQTPIGPWFEAVLERLDGAVRGRCVREAPKGAYADHPTLPQGAGALLAEGAATLLREHLGIGLEAVWALDPWAGAGEIARTLGAREVYANAADPVGYARIARREGLTAVLADSFRLPERQSTRGFDFRDDENAARIGDEQALDFPVVATDLRLATRPDARAARRLKETWREGIAAVRWMADRLATKGVIAFLSEEALVDEPAFAGMRAGLAREFGLVAHLALPEGLGITFLVRGGGGGRILYAEPSTTPSAFDAVEWRGLQPTETHVWRSEILRDEWSGFLPLVGARVAISTEEGGGSPDGADVAAPTPKARRVLRSPFVPAWRTLDRKARREPPPVEGPTIVVLADPFGVLAADAPVDRRLGGAGAAPLVAGGRPSGESLRRFRVAYGAAVTERDVFDAVLALLHHPEYRVRYREDLRRGVPRLPLPDEEALAVLARVPDAPLVGPGTAFRTGWIAEGLFEPGTVPDFDDPFASPYAPGRRGSRLPAPRRPRGGAPPGSGRLRAAPPAPLGADRGGGDGAPGGKDAPLGGSDAARRQPDADPRRRPARGVRTPLRAAKRARMDRGKGSGRGRDSIRTAPTIPIGPPACSRRRSRRPWRRGGSPRSSAGFPCEWSRERPGIDVRLPWRGGGTLVRPHGDPATLLRRSAQDRPDAPQAHGDLPLRLRGPVRGASLGPGAEGRLRQGR